MKFNTNKRHVVEQRSRKNGKSPLLLAQNPQINMIAKFCRKGYMGLHSYDTYCNLIKQSTQPCCRLLAGHQFHQQTVTNVAEDNYTHLSTNNTYCFKCPTWKFRHHSVKLQMHIHTHARMHTHTHACTHTAYTQRQTHHILQCFLICMSAH